MKKKSKFLVFMLSFLPGLSHFYVGFKQRALIFFMLFLGSIFGTLGICFLLRDSDPAISLIFVLPLIWFISMIDAISSIDKLSEQNLNNNADVSIESLENQNILGLGFTNKKLITVAFSLIPGAGHMYLGFQNRGLQLMTIFFFSTFLMDWLHMSLLIFILPVIWFYSFFDAFHRIEEEKTVKEEDEIQILSWISNHSKWTGWGLIILGCFTIFERIISPLINYQIRNCIQTGIVALILIGGGIKLLMGSKEIEVEAEREEVEE